MSVTTVPVVNEEEQAAPQVIPPGLLVTTPPVALFATLRTLLDGIVAKLAVTSSGPPMASVQEAVPLQAPVQPPKT
jgi:hypothetical protein